MKFLLDTCALAELRHPKGDRQVKEWVARLPEDSTFLSVLVIGEIQKGISLLPAGKRRRELEFWLQGLQTTFPERILPIDQEVARIWGERIAFAQKKGIVVPAIDGLLAATAICHGLHVVTRNTSHFDASGALVCNPWLR